MPQKYVMNRNHLALFESVAAAGSISAGAALARVSQPAVSRQIAELEDELGVKLLDRLPRGCRMTEAGAILADHARRWKGIEADAARAIGEYRGLERGRLSIGSSQTIGGYLLPGMLAQFHENCPGIELKVEIANTLQVQRLLLEGAIELGLTEGAADSDELQSEVFHEDELVVVAAAGHGLLGTPVTARQVCGEPLIMREVGSGTREVVERAFHKKGLKPQPFLSLASPEAIKNAVLAGLGLAVISRLSVASELAAGSLAVVPMKDLSIRRPLHRQCVRGRGRSPALEAFLGVMADALPQSGASKAPGARRSRSRDQAS